MKSGLYSFRLTWEDLDNIKYIKYYYAERRLTNTDVIRMALRDLRYIVESEADSDPDTTLKDFLRGVDMSNEELAEIGMASGAINPEPPLRSGEL